MTKRSDGVRVRLDSLNAAVAPIEVHAAGETEIQVLGELVEVLAPQ